MFVEGSKENAYFAAKRVRTYTGDKEIPKELSSVITDILDTINLQSDAFVFGIITAATIEIKTFDDWFISRARIDGELFKDLAKNKQHFINTVVDFIIVETSKLDRPATLRFWIRHNREESIKNFKVFPRKSESEEITKDDPFKE